MSFETSVPESVVEQLRDMGHAPQNPLMATAQQVFLGNNRGLVFGSGQAVMKLENGYVAASDSRRDRGLIAH